MSNASRNDGVLLTGMNSGTVSKVDRERMARQKKEKQEALATKAVMLPAAELILLEIDKEKKRAALELLDSVDAYAQTDEQHKSMMHSIQMYRNSMDRLHGRMKAIMRVEIKEAKK